MNTSSPTAIEAAIFSAAKADIGGEGMTRTAGIEAMLRLACTAQTGVKAWAANYMRQPFNTDAGSKPDEATSTTGGVHRQMQDRPA